MLVSDVCFRSLEDVVRAMPEWVKLDVAIEVMAEVLSDQRRAIANEEKKEKPDREKLERLKAEKRKLLQERQAMYSGNREVIHKILTVYGNKVRKKYTGVERVDSCMDPLSEEEHNEILERLKQEVEEFTAPAKHPAAVILGGQPGAGKGGLIALAENGFSGHSFVVINGDEFRKEHPMSKEILLKQEEDYARLTDPDVRRWTRDVFKYAIQTKRNLVFEGTMRTDGPICNTLQRLKQQGYRVIVRVMAVHACVSLLGTYERHEEQKQIFGYGRPVAKASHDAAYRGMLKTVERIEKEKLFDVLEVYNRDKHLLYENRVIGRACQKPPKAVEAIIGEREKKWTADQLRRFIQAWDQVLDKMVFRCADLREIGSARQHRDFIIKRKGGSPYAH